MSLADLPLVALCDIRVDFFYRFATSSTELPRQLRASILINYEISYLSLFPRIPMRAISGIRWSNRYCFMVSSFNHRYACGEGLRSGSSATLYELIIGNSLSLLIEACDSQNPKQGTGGLRYRRGSEKKGIRFAPSTLSIYIIS